MLRKGGDRLQVILPIGHSKPAFSPALEPTKRKTKLKINK